MTPALVLKRVASDVRERQGLDEPAPAIMADGLGGVCRRGWQYWLESPGGMMPAGVVPRDGEREGTGMLIEGAQPLPEMDLAGGAKPPYRVMSMDDVRALPWNGFTAASTFSGCGGSSLGYRMAGFRVLYANEFVEAARETYRLNCDPDTVLDGRDIRTVTATEMLDRMELAPGELDLLDGSPPCASFSTAGKREKKWGQVNKYSDRSQRSDDLFFEFARLLEGIQSRVFVAENVSGLVKGTAKGYFKEILARLKACGYRVEARLLDAQWLGVPQTRQRLIFVGVREDLGIAPVHPRPLAYRYSIRDALPWLTSAIHGNYASPFAARGLDLPLDGPAPTIVAGVHGGGPHQVYVEGLVLGGNAAPNRPGNSFPRNKRVSLDDPCPTVMAEAAIVGSAPHELVGCPPVEPESDISRFEVGREWDKLKPGEQSERFFQLVRPDPDGPSPTVTAAGGTASLAGVTHPFERRKFSIAELRRICGFPDDFALTGSYGQQWERLGRAVPPVMMAAVAATIRDEVLRKL